MTALPPEPAITPRAAAPPRGLARAARLGALASRYGALAAQFVIVVLVARGLGKADAGIYLALFGVMTTTTVFVGWGAPDGLVRAVPELIARRRDDAVFATVLKAAAWTGGSALVMVGGLLAIGAGRGMAPGLLMLAAGWWLAYAAVFFCGQALVALGRATLGAFVFYAANNLLLLVTTAPYLLLTHAPDVAGTLRASLAASALAAVFAAGLLAVTVRPWVRRLPRGGFVDADGAMGLGLVIALARMAQSALYWVPTWVVAAVSGPAEAALMGTAGRLLIAATAVIAVFRFTIRGRIVTAGARGDRAAITRMARAAATVATLCAVAALAFVLVAGSGLFVMIFGHGYRGVAPVLAMLLVGAIGESVGGPVDEVLKYQGQARPVLIGLIVTVAGEVLLARLLAPYGAVAAAAAQAIAFGAMYTFQIALCWRRLGILIVPYVRPRDLRAALAT